VTSKIWMQLSIALFLVLLIYLGRNGSEQKALLLQQPATTWSIQQSLLHKAIAGPLPGVAADFAILNIFDIYSKSLKIEPEKRAPLWEQLHYQLQLAQNMDPYFKDVYRLSEGLLAFEANKTAEAIQLLTDSEPYLNSFEPLLVASFLAHQELNDLALALKLAKKSATQPDASPLAVTFASRLIQKKSGCAFAMAFLKSRLIRLPEKYRQGIKSRIKMLKESQQCGTMNHIR